MVLLSIQKLSEVIETGDLNEPKTIKALFCAAQMVPSIVRYLEHKDVAGKLDAIERALKEAKAVRENYSPIIEDLFELAEKKTH